MKPNILYKALFIFHSYYFLDLRRKYMRTSTEETYFFHIHTEML